MAVNKIHKHFKNLFPTFQDLIFQWRLMWIFQLQIVTFYSGGTINFYAEGGGCQSTANIPDVNIMSMDMLLMTIRYNNQVGMWNGSL